MHITKMNIKLIKTDQKTSGVKVISNQKTKIHKINVSRQPISINTKINWKKSKEEPLQ